MKLGELFVDLGVNSGNALNSLTNFSIKFLALKTAASQVADSIENVFGDTMKLGQQLEKMQFITGLSLEWMQKMKNSAEQTGSSFETVIATLKNLQQENAKIMMGEGNVAPFQKLGIDVSMLRDPTELLDEIMAKIMRLEPAFKQAMLAELGISEDILFMYQQKTLEVEKALQLTEEETKNLNELNKEWVHLRQSISSWWDKKIAGMVGFFRGMVSLSKLLLGVENENPDKDIGDISLTDYLKNKNQDAGDVEIEAMPQDDNLDYFNRTEPMYSYGGSTVTYNDNSQTTINTSDGVEQYAKIAKEKVDKTKSEFGNIELFSRRG